MDCTWLLGDAITEMAKLPSASIDAIITDPPYNIGGYSTGNISAKWRKTLNNSIAGWDQGAFCVEDLVEPFTRLLKPTGTIFAFTTFNLIGDWHRCFDPLYDTFQLAVWHKTNPPPKIRRAGFLNSCEYIVCLWKKGHTWNFTRQNEMHNHFQGPICMGKERLKHPTQKPLWLLQRLVKLCTNTGDVVLDPYAGVASVGEAALRNGRNFIGIDNDPGYYKQGGGSPGTMELCRATLPRSGVTERTLIMLKNLQSLVVQTVLVECIAGLAALIILHNTNISFQVLMGLLVIWTIALLAITIWRMGNIKEDEQ